MMCEMNVHINITEESTNNKEYIHATEITIQNCHNNHLVFAVHTHSTGVQDLIIHLWLRSRSGEHFQSIASVFRWTL